MLKIYVGGACVSCHKAVKMLQYKEIPFVVETDIEKTIDVVSKTTGIVPLFEFDGKYYNEYQIEGMIESGFDFKIKPVVEEKVVVKASKITEVVNEK